MSEPVPAYPFDPTGLELTNKVTETQSIYAKDWKDFNMVIPKFAPFFITGLQIKLVSNNVVLQEGVDYLTTHKFLDASKATAKNVYGTVTFLNNELSGEIEITYQTLGGEWLVNETEAVALLSNKLVNPRVTTWEQVINVPDRFPVIDHQWNLNDMVGMSAVKEGIDEITQVLNERPTATDSLRVHTNNYSNPHNVTKAQINLGLVENFPPASETDALVAEKDDCYMTPNKTLKLVRRYAITSDKEYYTREEVDSIVGPLIERIEALESSS